MRLLLWLRFAARDLRSGLQGFWILLACLSLGTAAIAITGAVSAAVERGLQEQGQPLLGGDIEFALIHRQASAEEIAFMEARGRISLVATLRAMAKSAATTTLVEIKSADTAYPLYGELALDGGARLEDALAERDGRFGIAVDPLLLGRLGVRRGDVIAIGNTSFAIRATIASEPDRLSDGLSLGPRVLMRPAALAATGLVQPGSLVTWRYRVKLPEAANPAAVADEANARFPDAGWRIKDRSNAAQGARQFADRLGLFMTLVGLAALTVGGAGIGNAVTAFVNRRTASIATLKCLGASGRDIFGIYMAEVLAISLLAIAAGLAAGAIAPAIAQRTLAGVLPLPLAAGIDWQPLAAAGAQGLLAAFAFALWPVARTRMVPASALFRHRIASPGGWPGGMTLFGLAASLAAIVAVLLARNDDWRIIGWFLAGLAASFLVLFLMARLIIWTAARLPRPRALLARHALANIHRPGSHAASVVLALGLGLALFVTLSLTDRTISRELSSEIPAVAPAFFFLDVRNGELADFTSALRKEDGVTAIGTAPMLRGRIVAVNGVPVAGVKAAPDVRWALQGDRGLTYAEALPEGSVLTAGAWWPKDYAGPPLVSMAADVAAGIGLSIGDTITVNVLGRDITARIASLREVNWRSLGINFVMVFTPATLETAPHSHIVTVAMAGGDEAQLLNSIARQFPAVTAIRVKDAITVVSGLLGKMLNGIRAANVLTLLTGMLVLAGALAAGLADRTYDAVVLKTYGATRRQLIASFVIEYAALGFAAALFGILAGSLASWFLARFILEVPWQFAALPAVATALAAMTLTVFAGLAATWAALTARPAPMLRNE